MTTAQRLVASGLALAAGSIVVLAVLVVLDLTREDDLHRAAIAAQEVKDHLETLRLELNEVRNAARLAANFMLSQECQEFLARFGRLPTRKDVAANPPGIIDRLTQKKVITVLLGPDEERQWQRRFDQLLKGR